MKHFCITIAPIDLAIEQVGLWVVSILAVVIKEVAT